MCRAHNNGVGTTKASATRMPNHAPLPLGMPIRLHTMAVAVAVAVAPAVRDQVRPTADRGRRRLLVLLLAGIGWLLLPFMMADELLVTCLIRYTNATT